MSDGSKEFTCAVPAVTDHVELAHGGGGRKMRRLIETTFLPAFDSPAARERHDSAILPVGSEKIAFTTDSFVVSPLFFPGGDIGKLAVCGTVNDLACAGARPRWLSAAFVLEEGLPMAVLARVVSSMRETAAAASVDIVTGDTKVVDRGKGDGLYITTSGIGVVPSGVDVRPGRVREGDAILLTGDIGRHGVAVLSVRKGLQFAAPVVSDCAPLADLVGALVGAGLDVHCLRDLTRGGLAAALVEIAADGRATLEIEQDAIPVQEAVAGACELLGIDPLHVANEGRMVVFLPEAEAGRALDVLAATEHARGAVRIGSVSRGVSGPVLIRTRFGARRVLDLPAGEVLPRIC